MSTALATRANGAINAAPAELGLSTLEKVLLQGDLAKLSPEERVAYYRAQCDTLGLNPLSQPFAYIVLNGKLTLYAKKDCTDQLRKLHGVSVTGLEPRQVGDTYVVVCSVRDRDGRTDSATGAVCTSNLRGEALANALMKAETKSKRRATLSLCGLGMLDESEVDSIADARRVDDPDALRDRPQNQSGHGSGQYASPEQTDEYLTALRGWLDGKNAAWLDSWTGASGQCDLDGRNLSKSLVEPLNVHQADNHLLKWAVESGRLDHRIVPEDAKTRQLGRYVAIVFCRDKEGRKAVGKEMERYAALQMERAAEAIYRKCPDLAPQDEADDADPDAGPLAATDAERFAEDAWPEGRE